MWLGLSERSQCYFNGSFEDVSFYSNWLLQGNEDAKLRWQKYFCIN
jgi:hypothetical protein